MLVSTCCKIFQNNSCVNLIHSLWIIFYSREGATETEKSVYWFLFPCPSGTRFYCFWLSVFLLVLWLLGFFGVKFWWGMEFSDCMVLDLISDRLKLKALRIDGVLVPEGNHSIVLLPLFSVGWLCSVKFRWSFFMLLSMYYRPRLCYLLCLLRWAFWILGSQCCCFAVRILYFRHARSGLWFIIFLVLCSVTSAMEEWTGSLWKVVLWFLGELGGLVLV